MQRCKGEGSGHTTITVRESVGLSHHGLKTEAKYNYVQQEEMAENKVTYLCIVRPLLDSSTVLEGFSESFVSLLFDPVMGRGDVLSHHDGGMSTSLFPTSLRGQGMGFIV